MKNYRIYLMTIDNEIKSGKQRAKQISALSGTALAENVSKSIVVNGIQKSIEDVDDVNLFFSVIDWSGKIISHPVITNLGTTDAATNAMVANIKKDISAEDLYVYISEYEKGDNQEESAVVRLDAIPNSDLVLITQKRSRSSGKCHRSRRGRGD